MAPTSPGWPSTTQTPTPGDGWPSTGHQRGEAPPGLTHRLQTHGRPQGRRHSPRLTGGRPQAPGCSHATPVPAPANPAGSSKACGSLPKKASAQIQKKPVTQKSVSPQVKDPSFRRFQLSGSQPTSLTPEHKRQGREQGLGHCEGRHRVWGSRSHTQCTGPHHSSRKQQRWTPLSKPTTETTRFWKRGDPPSLNHLHTEPAAKDPPVTASHTPGNPARGPRVLVTASGARCWRRLRTPCPS